MLHAKRLVPWQSTNSQQQFTRFLATSSLHLKPRTVSRICSKQSSFYSNKVSQHLVRDREGSVACEKTSSRRIGICLVDVSRRIGRCLVDVSNTIARSDEPKNLNPKPLYDELQRYGVDFADYGFMVNDNSSSRAVSLPSTSSMDSRMGRKDIALKKRKAADLEVKRPTLKEESGVIEDWCAYLLISADSHKTYVGVTYDIRRRLRQHNGEIAGGAKAARAGRPWSLVCTVHGFATRSDACQFEWRWKAAAAKIKTVTRSKDEVYGSPLIIRRRAALAETLHSKDEWKDLQVEWRIPEPSSPSS
ncbi:hypothetical protein R1flu_001541 [Riccia fluitans]|uniref:GIY-YIG domain-containing protein n=1 Tax=Riccia fluitans TaxID=41844 RepID=A0ABD1Y3K4_9MARC